MRSASTRGSAFALSTSVSAETSLGTEARCSTLAATSGQSGAVAGGMKLHDVNGDGKITTDDRVILGNAQPKYTVGQNGFFGWRAFSLSYVLRAVEGNKVVNLN